MTDKPKKKLLIFASGTKDGGGSGFRCLAEATQKGVLQADIVAVISNHENGGVKRSADECGIPFEHLDGPFTAENYQKIVKKYDAEFVALSGWLKLVSGLNPAKTINIHPGPLPRFGGDGMYGIHVHEAVLEAYKKGEITETAMTMHFVTEEYDEGPVIFRCSVPIKNDDTPESLAKRVNEAEHKWQPIITNKVVTGEISWDGKDPKTLKGYSFIPS